MKRKTVQREAIEKVLREHQRPLGVDEILAYGRKIVPSLNQATVYRNLKLLLDSGWLDKITHPLLGALYEQRSRIHHHHFFCRSCNRAFDLPGCALDMKHAAPDGFIVEDHDIFLFGICPSCSRGRHIQKK